MIHIKSLLVIVALITVSYGEQYDSCQNPDNRPGECKIITQCPSLFSILQHKPIPQRDLNLLKDSKCGFEGTYPKVCCIDRVSSNQQTTGRLITNIGSEDLSNKASLLPDHTQCGLSKIESRIWGGEKASIDEFPWMVLIEYQKPNRAKGFYCGGALISSRYVLTAAHCLNGQDLPNKARKLISVRLGEYDTDSETDCVDVGFGKQVCSDAPVDIPIEERIVHEKYNPYDTNHHNDIALLRLSRDAPTSMYISPICLPLETAARNKDYANEALWVAGWGKTENTSESNFKLKVEVPVKTNSECNSVYNQTRVNLKPTQLCAGGEKGRDSCRGDSGGPLMALGFTADKTPVWYSVGIVSFGPNPCGMENQPGIYTRTSEYVDWILKNIKK